MKENRKIKHERLLSEELFVYADQFKTAALCDKIGELQLFAVQNGDETLYCRVQGKDGLAVYPGQNGLLSYMKALHLRQEDECPDWKLYESAFIEDCVKCTFEDRKTLDDWDYRCIIGLGRSYRGKQAWPMFRRHRPLRYPWYVDNGMKIIVEDFSIPIRKPWRYFFRRRRICTIIEQVKPDIIHMHFVTNVLMVRLAEVLGEIYPEVKY